MFCKWCGLESDTTDVCSWCGRPFGAAGQQQAGKPVETAPAVKVGEEAGAPVFPQPAVAPQPPFPEPDIVVVEAPTAGGPAFFDDVEEQIGPVPFATPVDVREPPPAAGPGARPVPLVQESAPPASVQPPPPREPEVRAEPLQPMETIPVRRPSPPPDVIPVARRPAAPVTPEPAADHGPSESAPIPVRGRPSPGPSGPGEAQPTPPTVPPMTQSVPRVPPVERVPTPPPRPVPVQQPLVGSGETPVLDLPPRIDEPEEIVAGGPGRLDLTDEPAPVMPPPIQKPKPGPLPAFARPIPQTTVEIPKAGGRTWYCRWCGMESDSPDRCSWCHKDLRSLPTGGSGKGPVLAASKRQPIRVPRQPERQPRDGKGARPAMAAPSPSPAPATPAARTPVAQPAPAPVRPTPPPVAAASGGGAAVATPQPAVRQGVPSMGSFQPQKSKYYPDQVVDPVSGRHYNADTGETTDTPVEMREDLLFDERSALLRQTGIYLAALVAGVIIFATAARVLPQWYLAFVAALNVGAGMAMPPLGVAPYGEDDSSDVPIAIPLILVLGPIVGGMAYGVIAIMRQDANPAIVGIFVTYLIIRFPLQLAAGTGLAESLQSLVPFSPPPDGNWGAHLALQWLPFATMAGWYGASIFHKPDE